LMDC